jgi:uncharacterized membrane protein
LGISRARCAGTFGARSAGIGGARVKVLCNDQIDVAAPAERAFAFASDISRWPLWFTPVVCAQHPDSLPLAPKEELLLCLQSGRRRWQERFEVTRFVRNAFLSLEGAYSAARRIDFRFEQRGAVTRVICAIGYRVFGGFFASGFDSLFRRRRVRNEIRESLHRLKGLLEEAGEMPAIDHIVDEVPERLDVIAPAARVEEPAGVS